MAKKKKAKKAAKKKAAKKKPAKKKAGKKKAGKKKAAKKKTGKKKAAKKRSAPKKKAAAAKKPTLTPVSPFGSSSSMEKTTEAPTLFSVGSGLAGAAGASSSYGFGDEE